MRDEGRGKRDEGRGMKDEDSLLKLKTEPEREH
jgi:hypothetical protein